MNYKNAYGAEFREVHDRTRDDQDVRGVGRHEGVCHGP